MPMARRSSVNPPWPGLPCRRSSSKYNGTAVAWAQAGQGGQGVRTGGAGAAAGLRAASCVRGVREPAAGCPPAPAVQLRTALSQSSSMRDTCSAAGTQTHTNSGADRAPVGARGAAGAAAPTAGPARRCPLPKKRTSKPLRVPSASCFENGSLSVARMPTVNSPKGSTPCSTLPASACALAAAPSASATPREKPRAASRRGGTAARGSHTRAASVSLRSLGCFEGA